MTFFKLVSQSLDTVPLKQKRIWSLYSMYHILEWLVAHCKTQWGFFENKNVLHFLSFRKLVFINFTYNSLNFTNSLTSFAVSGVYCSNYVCVAWVPAWGPHSSTRYMGACRATHSTP